MKSYRKELWFNVPARRAFINVTLKWFSQSGHSKDPFPDIRFITLIKIEKALHADVFPETSQERN
jgi:hypothetical protein